ncbi:MAG: hypothetical protein MHM6MM_006645, partial [Cercozoa sp. M6MM]
GGVAVRVAVAETQVVQETKQWLTSHGVDLGAFQGKRRATPRSDTVLLVKNLPYDDSVTEQALRDLFGPGNKSVQLGRVLLPPTKVLAIVEFFEPSEAKAAFRRLAYRNFHNVPLYLEWAPQRALSESQKPERPQTQAESKQEENEAAAADEDEQTGATTLFVKNLNFDTTSETLEHAFSKHGKLRSARVVTHTKKRARGQEEVLSRGFGFVEFESARDAQRALDTMQGTVLDGHTLDIALSETAGGKTRGKGKSAKGMGTKITVKNLAFQAKPSEVRALFATYGQLKSLRMPKKFNGGHRGFAFVEFVTQQEALAAFEALSASTRLYGRRLVLEWANAPLSETELREQATEVAEGQERAPKRQKTKRIESFDE